VTPFIVRRSIKVDVWWEFLCIGFVAGPTSSTAPTAICLTPGGGLTWLPIDELTVEYATIDWPDPERWVRQREPVAA